MAESTMTRKQAILKIAEMKKQGLTQKVIHERLVKEGYIAAKTGQPPGFHTIGQMLRNDVPKLEGTTTPGTIRTKSAKVELGPTADQQFMSGLRDLMNLTSMDPEMRLDLIQTMIEKRKAKEASTSTGTAKATFAAVES